MKQEEIKIEILGKYLFKFCLYLAISGLITLLVTMGYMKSHEWLGIKPDNFDPPLINPFWLLAVMVQFFAFKQIFMKNRSLGLAFISWIGTTVGIIIVVTLIFSLIVDQQT